MFPGLRCPSRQPVAHIWGSTGHRHVRAVTLEDDECSTISLRFEFLRFRAGGRNGRGSRTKICAMPGELTVISFPVAEKTYARGRRREPSEAEGRRGRAWISTGPAPSRSVPVFVIFVPSAKTCDATW